MKPEKAKPENEVPMIQKKEDKNRKQLFIFCERCGRAYKDINNLPMRCDFCGACLLCQN